MEDMLARLMPFWRKLDSDSRANLAARARTARYTAGELVQGGGSTCANVLFVTEGRLRAYMVSEAGKEVTLFWVEAGECCVLAASCILPMITFDIALSAATDSSLIAVDASYFGTLAQTDVNVEAFTYRQALMRFSDCVWVMQQVLFMSMDERLAVFLLDEAARTGSATLELTHDQIARHMGSAREVVTRMLRYFAREGIVALSRGRVEIRDRARLRELTAR